MNSSETLESLFLFSHSPYNSNLCKEGLDLVLASAAFDCKLALVLTDDAIFAALEQHNAASIGQKDISKILQVLPLYDIEQLYYCQASAAQRGLAPNQLSAQFKPLNNDDINALISRSQQVYHF